MSALDVQAMMEPGAGVLRGRSGRRRGREHSGRWRCGRSRARCRGCRPPCAPRCGGSVGLKCLVGLCAPGAVRLPLLPASEAPVALVRGRRRLRPSRTRARSVKGGGGALPVVRAPVPRRRAGLARRCCGEPLLLLWLGASRGRDASCSRGWVQLRRIRRGGPARWRTPRCTRPRRRWAASWASRASPGCSSPSTRRAPWRSACCAPRSSSRAEALETLCPPTAHGARARARPRPARRLVARLGAGARPRGVLLPSLARRACRARARRGKGMWRRRAPGHRCRAP